MKLVRSIKVMVRCKLNWGNYFNSILDNDNSLVKPIGVNSLQL
jgi:hypothetical protein